MAYGVSKFPPYYGVGAYNGFSEIFDVNTNKWYQSPSVFSDTMDTTTNWTASDISGTTPSFISSVNGELKILNNGATYGSAIRQENTVIGKKYKLIVSLTSKTGIAAIRVGSTLTGYDITLSTDLIVGDFEDTFTAPTTITYITLYNGNTSGAISTWDNYAIYPINNDGSVDTSSATPITESRNYLDAVVYADAGGQPTYVEQLPKIEYKDVVKANEYQGKNACTAWVNFDGTTTPPTIRDSFNVSAVIRTATGYFDIYFKTPMDNANYSVNGTGGYSGDIGVVLNPAIGGVNKITVYSRNNTAFFNNGTCLVQIFGGKN